MYCQRIFIFNLFSLVYGTLFPHIGHHDESFFVPAEANDVAKDLCRSFFQSDVLSFDQDPYEICQMTLSCADQLPRSPHLSSSILDKEDQHSAFETAVPQDHGPGHWTSEGSDLLQHSSADRTVQYADVPGAMNLERIPGPKVLDRKASGTESAGPKLKVQVEICENIGKGRKRKLNKLHAMSRSQSVDQEWKSTIPENPPVKIVRQPKRGLKTDLTILTENEAATMKQKTQVWPSSENDVEENNSPSGVGVVESDCDHSLRLLLKEADSVGSVDERVIAGNKRFASTRRKVYGTKTLASQMDCTEFKKMSPEDSSSKTAAATTRDIRRSGKRKAESDANTAAFPARKPLKRGKKEGKSESKTATKTRKVEGILADEYAAEQEGSPSHLRTSPDSTPPAPSGETGIFVFDPDMFDNIKARSSTPSNFPSKSIRRMQRDFSSFCKAYMQKQRSMRFQIEESKAKGFLNKDYSLFVSSQREKRSSAFWGSETSHHRLDGAGHGVTLLLKNEGISKSLYTQEIMARKDEFSQTLTKLAAQASLQVEQSGPAEWKHEAVLRAEPMFLFLVKLINTIVQRGKQYDANWIEQEQTRAWKCFASFWEDVGFTEKKLNAPDTRAKYPQNVAIHRIQNDCFNTLMRKRNIFAVAWGLVPHWLRICRGSLSQQLKYKPGPKGKDISPRFMHFFNNLIRFTANELHTRQADIEG